MALKVAARGTIPPFIVMDVLRAANERAAAGETVHHLEVGQPGTRAPRRVIEAAQQALETDLIGYTDAFGIPPLRQGIAAHYRAQYGVELDPGRVVVTTGNKTSRLVENRDPRPSPRGSVIISSTSDQSGRSSPAPLV